MLGRLKKVMKNRGGFTLVELIVVIVIILVLAAALVPQLLKYVDQANRANCQSEAATLLSQVQADYTASLASEQTQISEDFFKEVKYQGITVTQVEAIPGTELKEANAQFVVTKRGNDENEVSEEITKFAYCNGKYTATWEITKTNGTTGGWKVEKAKSSDPDKAVENPGGGTK